MANSLPSSGPGIAGRVRAGTDTFVPILSASGMIDTAGQRAYSPRSLTPVLRTEGCVAWTLVLCRQREEQQRGPQARPLVKKDKYK